MLRQNRLTQILTQALTPDLLEVNNESHQHHVPKNSETHFKLVIVAKKFQNLTRIDRHRLVNNLLAQEFESGLHALTMHLSTPAEWSLDTQVAASPSCRDGYQK